MNEYLTNKIKNLDQNAIKDDLGIFEGLNISSDDDFYDFVKISGHGKDIIKDLIGNVNNDDLAKISSIVYESRANFPIDNIHDLYKAVENAAKQLSLPLKNINKMAYKVAYPTNSDGIYAQSPHNIPQWIECMKKIYAYSNQTGCSVDEAMNLFTKDWQPMDKQDFQYWLKFYQDDSHKKYKKASVVKEGVGYLSVGPGGYLPFDKNDLRSTIPGVPNRIPDMEQFDQSSIANEANNRKLQEQKELDDKEHLKAQVKALIGRLNSAERLATTSGIDKVLGPVYETWLKALHDLKREIQIAPLRNIKSSLDLIYKKANLLEYIGQPEASKVMVKLAQALPDPSIDPAAVPSKNIAQPGNDVPTDLELPPVDPTASAMPTANELEPDKTDSGNEKWLDEFLENLSGTTDTDEENDVSDSDDDLYVDEDDLVKNAQAVPGPDDVKKVEDKEHDLPQQPSGFHTEMDRALSTVTVKDVVDKLKSLSNVFKNREISRELAKIDIMLDALGIASYFPALAEATQRSLDANQYMLIRIDDVLSALEGSLAPPQVVDWKGEKPPQAANKGSGIAQNLSAEEQKEAERSKARDEARKAQEDATLNQAQAPVNPGAEVANAPTNVETPPVPPANV